ncbi:MAG: thiamine-phosphate kinase [Chloroflexota bacterium]
MRVSEIGEFGLIDRLQQEFSGPAPGIVIGIGDDTAVWRSAGLALATTDTLVEDVHFRFSTITWEELGWKSLAVNLSDIAAMGGEPQYALLTLGLPGDAEVEGILRMARGLATAGREFNTAVIGGDIVGSPRAMFITVALYGAIPADEHASPLLRSAARAGDLVAVTGWLGRSAAGFRLLSGERQAPREALAELRRAHNRPWPRVKEGPILRQLGVKAALDISDGLAGDAGHMAQMSGVGVRLRAEALPVHPLVRQAFGDQAFALALTGGEEYELLFAAPPEVMARAREALSKLGTPVTVVGEVVPEPAGQVLLAWPDGREEPVEKGGWDHFRG